MKIGDALAQAQRVLFERRGRLETELEEIRRQLRSLDDVADVARAVDDANAKSVEKPKEKRNP